jgi:hypothetical protein
MSTSGRFRASDSADFYQTAYHEAGHAVMFSLLRDLIQGELVCCTIEPQNDVFPSLKRQMRGKEVYAIVDMALHAGTGVKTLTVERVEALAAKQVHASIVVIEGGEK